MGWVGPGRQPQKPFHAIIIHIDIIISISSIIIVITIIVIVVVVDDRPPRARPVNDAQTHAPTRRKSIRQQKKKKNIKKEKEPDFPRVRPGCAAFLLV